MTIDLFGPRILRTSRTQKSSESGTGVPGTVDLTYGYSNLVTADAVRTPDDPIQTNTLNTKNALTCDTSNQPIISWSSPKQNVPTPSNVKTKHSMRCSKISPPTTNSSNLGRPNQFFANHGAKTTTLAPLSTPHHRPPTSGNSVAKPNFTDSFDRKTLFPTPRPGKGLNSHPLFNCSKRNPSKSNIQRRSPWKTSWRCFGKSETNAKPAFNLTCREPLGFLLMRSVGCC